ncbi:MAG: YbaB/EbfC family nucleoid-associated protein [Hyphomicrobiales bacterium]|nr:MAG: YbaB/EbfC family nucleoid-associated protein [Hyphomicrobiales bacterium]
MKNLAGLMKQAQEMQSKMSAMQDSLAELRVSGAAGAGLVEVSLSGKGEMVGLHIDESLLKPGEGEILEDLIVAAHGQAKARLEQEMAEKMKEVTGGMALPPGMNFGL